MQDKTKTLRPANRLDLDYSREAETFTDFDFPIIDVHTHINGALAAPIYGRVAKKFGIGLTYSMTNLDQVEVVKEALGDRVRIIAMPKFSSDDPVHALTDGFVTQLEQFYAAGSRIAKFWAAPRGRDFGEQAGQPDLLKLTAPHRLDAMERASELGMIFMAHVGDPNTWFQTKYSDSERYGTKLSQYEPLEEVLEKYTQPWILAHMGGWPEDLEFLSNLLSRHDNAYLDTSATKWMVRELSKHPRQDLIDFFTKWSGRVMFGSDVVTRDMHLSADSDHWDSSALSSNETDAFDLYASRYYALRTLLETDSSEESPIADPDLAMVDPKNYDETSAPILNGKSLPAELLRTLYHDAAHNLLEPLYGATE